MDLQIDIASGDRVIGAIQNADVQVRFATRTNALNEQERVGATIAERITVSTDLVYLFNLDSEVVTPPPYTIAAHSEEGEGWCCEECVIDPDQIGQTTKGRNGLIMKGYAFTARSFRRDGETITVPVD